MYAYLFGNFDINRIPLAPPDTKVLIHKKSQDWGSWDYQGVVGWYVGPSLAHYWCLICYNADTFSEVDTDTLNLIPNKTSIPVYSDVYIVTQAIDDIVHILKNPAKSNIATVLWGDAIENAFQQVAKVLHNDNSSPLPNPTQPKFSLTQPITK